jgi:hypothetical protein
VQRVVRQREIGRRTGVISVRKTKEGVNRELDIVMIAFVDPRYNLNGHRARNDSL